MPATTGCPDAVQYQRLITGELPAGEVEALLSHLEGCAACVRHVAAVAEQDSLAQLVRQVGSLNEPAWEQNVALLIQRLRKHLPMARPSQEEVNTIPPRDPAPARGLTVPCSSCGKALKVKNGLAGKKVKCPHCGGVMPVPTSAPAGIGGEAPLTRGGSAAISQAPAPAPVARGTTSAEKKADMVRELTEILAPPQAPDELGRLGPYRVLEVLGKGGMGVVYKAEDPQLRRLVALKAMLPRLALSNEARQRFLREAQAAAAITHDHIVGIY
jgi:hypothetical protein